MEALIVCLFILAFMNGWATAILWQKLRTFCELYDTVSHNSIANMRYLESLIHDMKAKPAPKVKKTSLTQNTNAPIKKPVKQSKKDKP